MNLLNLNLPRCHFHTLIELAKSGHNVYTNWNGTNKYEASFGIKCLTKEENVLVTQLSSPMNSQKNLALVETLIDKYNIDILQVSIPQLAYLHTHFKDKIKYIGPPEEVSNLETKKLYARSVAEGLNIKVPSIIKHGKYLEEDYCKDLTFPCVEKPSYHWSPAIVINNEEEAREVKKCADMRDWPRHINNDYYIEEFLHDMIETNVFFAVSNGKYIITHTQEIIGEGLNKTIIPSVWYFNAYIKPLSPLVDKIVRQEAEKYLDHIATMGGNWEGTFCGAYTSKGEWYFLETNVRPDVFNSTPTFMTGDEYIKGMFEDISLFAKAWEYKNIQKLLITTKTPNNPYPIDLHVKYGVEFPNNLEITDNDYFVSDYGIGDSNYRGTVIADHNIPQEFIKEVEETTQWKFNEEPK